jgi:hypothetical protein
MGGHAAIEFVRAALAGQIVRCAHLKSSIVIAVCATAIEPGDQPERGQPVAVADAAIPEADSRASGCDIYLSVVFPGIKGGAVAVVRDTEFEPGERWFYDYRTEEFFAGPKLPAPHSRPLDQPVPGPAGRVPSNWKTLLHE